MIYTARQIEDLWKAGGADGQVVLPYRARLSPLAADWVKAKKIAVGYADDVTVKAAAPRERDAVNPVLSQSEGNRAAYLWWCDGPCGTAKAALMAQSRESVLGELPVPSDRNQLVGAIRRLAAQVKAGRAAGGILVLQAGAAALVYANRCPCLRAVLGTCLESVEQGLQTVAANVLIIEHPHKTLSQIKSLLSRFVKAKRDLSDETKRNFEELSSCG